MSASVATFLLLHGAASSGWYWHLVEPLLAAADRLVLVAAMIPNPGERGRDWWTNTGQPTAQRASFVELGLDPVDMDNPDVVYGHDIPPDVWVDAGHRTPDQSGRPFDDPCPITSWPATPTHVLAARDDRLFPLEFQRRVVMDRLELDVEVVPGGHLPALSQPQAVADALLRVAGDGRAPRQRQG